MMTALQIASGLVVLAAASLLAQGGKVYLDPSQPIERRIADVISQMTLEEKAAELNHLSSRNDRLHIPAWGGWNQTLHGVWSKQPTTLFPTAIGMAATWDPALIKTITDAMSDEARALYNIAADGPRSKHGLVYRSPVINISRDPRWGRIQECFGEDPYLAGRITVAYVQGLQGNNPKYLKVAATLKHFAVNNVETDRHSLSARVPERILMEYWLPHWKAGIVEGHAQSVMASYNELNGVPNIANHYLLTEVLRGLWHFDGFVVSDLGGVNSSLVQGSKITDRIEVAVAKAIAAGCDLDDNFYEQSLPVAVRSGLVSEEVVNQALTRVLRVAFRLGAFDPPEMVSYSKLGPDAIESRPHREMALKTAQESIVLLKQQQRVSAAGQGELKSVAVIGPQADKFETGQLFRRQAAGGKSGGWAAGEAGPGREGGVRGRLRHSRARESGRDRAGCRTGAQVRCGDSVPGHESESGSGRSRPQEPRPAGYAGTAVGGGVPGEPEDGGDCDERGAGLGEVGKRTRPCDSGRVVSGRGGGHGAGKRADG